MSWARLDDAFHDHPKVDGISLAAVGLYTLCLTWAHRHRRTAILPGHISEARVAKVAGRQANKLAGELVTAGLWELENGLGGYVIHDFADYLPKERDPEERAEAGRRGGKKRWEERSKPDSNLPSNLPQEGMASDSSRASAPAFPSRTRPEVLTTDLTTFDPPSAPRTLNQRANDLADHYAELVPLCNHQAVAGIVKTALRAVESGRANYSDSQIAAALERLADDNRTVTANTLRHELDGPPINGHAIATGTQRALAAHQIANRLREAGQ